MILNSITLRQFRSYEEASFEFNKGVNIIIGPNASGKTNLIEAIYLICSGKGFRTRTEKDVLKTGADWARIDVNLNGQDSRIIKLQQGPARVVKQFEIGGNKKSRLSFDDLVPIVLFEPDHLRLGSGGPERRRDYLDGILAQLIPSYRKDILAYERVLRQRNTLLKRQQAVHSDFFPWDVQLVELASRIVLKRSELVEQLKSQATEIYSDIAAEPTSVGLRYQTAIPLNNYASHLMRKLEQNRPRDIMLGFTSAGAHRDELIIELNGRAAKVTASRGENRTLVLALKILELRLLEEARHEPPILLLDDVFSELDGSRRKHLTDFFTSHQVFITTTDADVLMKTTKDASFISL